MQPVCMALMLHAHVRRYFSEAASQLPTILNNVLHNFYATAALSTSPLIITEYGRYASPFLHSCPAALAMQALRLQSLPSVSICTGDTSLYLCYPRYVTSKCAWG